MERLFLIHILEQSSFQKYTMCLVFLAPHNLLYLLCLCILFFFISVFDAWEYHYWYPWFQFCALWKTFRALWAKSQITPLRRVMFAFHCFSQLISKENIRFENIWKQWLTQKPKKILHLKTMLKSQIFDCNGHFGRNWIYLLLLGFPFADEALVQILFVVAKTDWIFLSWLGGNRMSSFHQNLHYPLCSFDIG